jgi:tetratricopeptide (TPR) repeat protein
MKKSRKSVPNAKKEIQYRAINGKSIRTALRAWNLTKELSVHPLTELKAVKAWQRAAGYSETPIGRGLALREILRAAIETLRPNHELPNRDEKHWWAYIILTEQFFHRRTPDFIATDLNISRRTFYSEQEQAVEKVIEVLCHWETRAQFEPVAIPDSSSTGATAKTQAANAMLFLAPLRPPHPLIGRDRLFSEIKSWLLNDHTAVSGALHGLPGVGKTALAIELAHDPDIQAHFNDGVLWISLGRQPDILASLGGWAMALSVSAERIAQCASVAEYARAIHAVIGLRHMLLIIDDAWQLDDALAFKVGGFNCAYLVTTRLASLAMDFAGERTVTVHELDSADSLSLLTKFAPHVVEADPEEAHALVQRGGGLPLALILIGGYLRRQSHAGQIRRLQQTLLALREAEARLRLTQPKSLLEQQHSPASAEWLSLQASISVSDGALDAAARQALRDLAFFPPKPNTFSEEAALTVAAMPTLVLDNLVDYGLIEHIGEDRYTLHQAITDYARYVRTDVNAPDQGETLLAAGKRFARHFTQYMADHISDLNVFDLERHNFLTALGLAIEYQLWEEFSRGASALYSFLMNRGLYLETTQYVSNALALLSQTRHAERYKLLSAREISYDILGRREAQRRDLDALEELAETLDDNRCRAEVALRCAVYAAAISDNTAILVNAQKAIALAQTIPDSSFQAAGYLRLGLLQRGSGNYADAKIYLDRALGLCREVGNQQRESVILNCLGGVSGDQNDFVIAQDYYEQSLCIASEIGYRLGQAEALGALGGILQDQGYYTDAHRYLKQALDIFHEMGDQLNESLVLNCLGAIARNQGDYSCAQDYLEQALYLSREIDQPQLECGTLIDLSLLFHRLGDDESAQAYSQQGLSIAQEIGVLKNQGYGLLNLAHALAGLERWAEATSTYQQAVDLWRELDQHGLAMEALAGLAHVSLAQNDLVAALTYAEKIWEYLEHNSLGALGDPGWVYLSCYRVFQAHHDPRAQNVLHAAYNLLQTNATKIEDEDMRRSFLENVSTHHELIETWKSTSNVSYHLSADGQRQQQTVNSKPRGVTARMRTHRYIKPGRV